MDEVRAPNYELAEVDYKNGMKYKDIAEKYGVSLSAVKSWASRYWKPKGCNQSKGEVATKKKKVATKGAQSGNKNAVGHGGTGPPNNKNAVKTGEFETLFFDTLNQDEMQLIGMIQSDKEQLLLQEIQLLTVRERRMLQRIDSIKDSIELAEDGTVIEGMTVVSVKSGIEKGQPTELKEYQCKLGQIQAIEDALTRVQARRQKAIEMLHKFGYDDARLEMEAMKLELIMLKQGGSGDSMEDDGFMEAINTTAGDIWSDEDE